MSKFRNTVKTFLFSVALLALVVSVQGTASAALVTFTTTGIFSVSGTNTAAFTSGPETTTLVFNGTANSINTPAGVSFGDILATSTSPSGSAGPALAGAFTLTVSQTVPSVANSNFVANLTGTLGFESDIATLNFTTTSFVLGGITYNINPSYTLALPVTGSGGNATTGDTTLQGTVTGNPPPAVPEPASMALIGLGLTGLGLLKFRRKA